MVPFHYAGSGAFNVLYLRTNDVWTKKSYRDKTSEDNDRRLR
jgi:hypothetical protein